MIRYALVCDFDHEFEGWFGASGDFDDQQARGLVECPICTSRAVRKQIMAPSVAVHHVPAQTRPMAMIGNTETGGKDREIRAMLRAFRQHLEANAENVGAEFADEARKIHYGETDERPIYGVASSDDAKALNDEGIEVLPIPLVPDEMN